MLKKFRRYLSLSLVLLSASLFVWAFLPDRHQVIIKDITPVEMKVPSGDARALSLLETYQVRLEWPSSMRIGNKAEITLVFTPAQSVIASTNLQPGSGDVYNDFNIMVEGRFETAGIKASPDNPIRESLPAGQTVKLRWEISAEKARSYQNNTMWLSLRYLPLNGDPASQKPIFIQEMDIQATSLWGISGPMARLMGGMGVVSSVLVVIDDIIGVFKKWIRKLPRRV